MRCGIVAEGHGARLLHADLLDRILGWQSTDADIYPDQPGLYTRRDKVMWGTI